MLAKEDVYAFLDSLPEGTLLYDAYVALQERFLISGESSANWVADWVMEKHRGEL